MDFRIKKEACLSCVGRCSFSLYGKKRAFTTAFEVGDRLIFKAYIPRQLGAISVKLSLINDESKSKREIPLEWDGLDSVYDVYESELSLKEKGLFFYRVELRSALGDICARKKGYYGEMYFEVLNENSPFDFQLTVSDFKYPAPSWLNGGIIYHVFVDRFCRKGELPVKKNAVLNENWDEGTPEYPEYFGAHLENNTFFGGNLYGVTEKLDYIASLGVNCIYLSPVFEAYSNHKYDTGDYMKIDEMFGGEEAFSELLTKAREKNIGIILDGVFNHTGDDSLYFNKYGNYNSVGAYQSKKSPYYSWYTFESFPDEYKSWWGIKVLPKLNLENEKCRDYFLAENGVIDRYSKMGISGMRLDVADELEDDFIKGIKEAFEKNKKDAVLYGEVWEDASNKIAYGKRKKYFLGDELDGVMNYPVRRGIIEYIRYGSTEPLRYALCEVIPNCPKRVLDVQMNLLGTHDTERILTALASPSSDGKTPKELSSYRLPREEYERAVRLLKSAYMILATLPGIPVIFYGDEAGMEGYGDPFNRMPFPWKNINEDLLSFYRKVGKIRRNEALYKSSDFELLCLDENRLIFRRIGRKYSAVTIINRAQSELKIDFDCEVKLLLGGAFNNNTVELASESCCIVKMPNTAKLKIR